MSDTPTFQEAVEMGQRVGGRHAGGYSRQATKAEAWGLHYALSKEALYEWLCRHYEDDYLALYEVEGDTLQIALHNDIPYLDAEEMLDRAASGASL